MQKNLFPKSQRVVPPQELPSPFDPDTIYVCYHGDKIGEPYLVNFICPCGCSRECPIPAVTSEAKQANPSRSAWGVRIEDDNTVTIHPSVRWTSGCKAHFTITNGRVQWHDDSGR